MSRQPADVLRSITRDKVLARLKTCVQYYHDWIKPGYRDNYLNVKLLRHAVESCLLDICRMKNFHGIEYADCHKRAAFSMLWITRAHPIQLATNANMTESLLVINEIYALGLGLAHININTTDISSKWYRNMIYILHFRNPAPEILASEMYVLECALKKQLP